MEKELMKWKNWDIDWGLWILTVTFLGFCARSDLWHNPYGSILAVLFSFWIAQVILFGRNQVYNKTTEIPSQERIYVDFE